MPLAALFIRALAIDRSVLLPRNSFAFEQHSSVVRLSKLVLLKKKCKINVSQKQQMAGVEPPRCDRVSLNHKTKPETALAKSSKISSAPLPAVRTRRAYFDCQFGQLHVRTAFPTTGGFDEGVTLVCLHAREGSSRIFDRLLPEIAAARSVYAPDLPGFGESDAAPTSNHSDAAKAVSDLSNDLRLRQIDLLGVRFGAAVALELAASRPELVRRVILVGSPPLDRIPAVKQPCLVVKTAADRPEETRWANGVLPHARVVEIGAPEFLDSDPRAFAERIGPFLAG